MRANSLISTARAQSALKRVSQFGHCLAREAELALHRNGKLPRPDFLIVGVQKGGTTWLHQKMKIIFLLRNPIERAWSQAIMNLKRFDHIEFEGNEDQYARFVSNNLYRGYYSIYLERWISTFGRDQVFIGLYDDMIENSDALYSDILAFLATSSSVTPNLSEKVNVNPKLDIPDSIRRDLERKFESEIRTLKTKFGLRVDSWLEFDKDSTNDGVVDLPSSSAAS